MRVFLYIIFLLSVIACQREINSQIRVNGKVINRITGQPVAGVRVKLLSCENPSLSYGVCTTIEIVYTDNSGNFHFEYNDSPGRHYLCELYESDYYSSNSAYNINNRAELTEDETQNVTLNVVPISKLKWKIYNTSCFDSTDLFTLYKQNQISNYNWGTPFQMAGCANYDGLTYGEYPMGYFYLHWQVTKNSITQDFYDTLYLAPFQDTVYTINY